MGSITPQLYSVIERNCMAQFWAGKLHARDLNAIREEEYITRNRDAARNAMERAIERAIDAAAGKRLNVKKLKAIKIIDCSDLTKIIKTKMIELGYKTLADFDKVSDKTLLGHINVGRGTVDAIRAAMDKYGMEV
jgi:hypothetical protein